MINLIPPHAHKGVVTEYWLRVFEVWLLLLGSALLIVAVLHLPVYVLLNKQKNTYAVEAAEAQALSLDLNSTQTTIKRTNEIARLLVQQDSSIPFTTYIERLENLTDPQISISEVTLTREDTGQVTSIQLTGMASTRQALADYRRTIEADDLFDTVELPISNLAKDEDILFSVRITPSNPTGV